MTTYAFTVHLTIADFQRILSWGNKKEFDSQDKSLSSKLAYIVEDMIFDEKNETENVDGDD